MLVTFTDGPAEGRAADVPGAPERVAVLVTPDQIIVTSTRDLRATVYLRDLATADGATYRVAHPAHGQPRHRAGAGPVTVRLVDGPGAGLTLDLPPGSPHRGDIDLLVTVLDGRAMLRDVADDLGLDPDGDSTTAYRVHVASADELLYRAVVEDAT